MGHTEQWSICLCAAHANRVSVDRVFGFDYFDVVEWGA
jgi:hypothetical protein